MKQSDLVGVWKQTTPDNLPPIVDGKAKDVLVITDKNLTKIAYYFPYRFKSVEWEYWDDYNQNDFPYTEDDVENEKVWLRPGFYQEIECGKCDGYWNPLTVTHWQPLPLSDLTAEAVQGVQGEREKYADMEKALHLCFNVMIHPDEMDNGGGDTRNTFYVHNPDQWIRSRKKAQKAFYKAINTSGEATTHHKRSRLLKRNK